MNLDSQKFFISLMDVLSVQSLGVLSIDLLTDEVDPSCSAIGMRSSPTRKPRPPSGPPTISSAHVVST
jgi:hypothetical protein